MVSKLRISGIIDESIVDGPGLRLVVFTQGCPHHCKGCHNPQTHDFDGGYDITVEEIVSQFSEDPLLAGITFSGGEPFCQAKALCHLASEIKKLGKNVMTYSGYTFEQLKEMAKEDAGVAGLLENCDILVDGPYVEAQRDLDLLYRGSSNQRILKLEDFR